ncbi:MAG: patatin-like phospholipase family protein [Proteobacteria bacterium]|nr:patatin-like phospholipase family protein [Pseudomonadota bacterium]
MKIKPPKKNTSKIALMLPGGGARGAYQVGVLKAIMQFLPKDSTPFSIITGTSAGAINATVLASYATNLPLGAQNLEKFWTSIHCKDVYRTDAWVILKTLLGVFGAALFGRFGLSAPKSLLDSSPLKSLLEREMHLSRIQDAIDQGVLDGVAVTASSYATASASSFFQAHKKILPWHRTRRFGIKQDITVEHVMASAALPFLFPAQLIGNEYYGDGGLRMTAPLSPAIHLGADRILIIGTRDENPIPTPTETTEYPSMGELGGYMLDTIFMDTLMADLSRLKRINRTWSLIPEKEKSSTQAR